MRECQCYSSAIYPLFIFAFQAYQSKMRDEKRLLERWVGPKEREEEELGGVRGTRGRLVEVGAVDGRSLSQTVTQNGSLGWRCSRIPRQPRKQVSSL